MARQLSILWVAVLTGVALRALAEETPAPTPAAPEVKRTVEAVVGKWAGQMSTLASGEAAERFTFTIDCEPAALGAGATCTQEGKASFGPVAERCVIAYDPDGAAVHKMCVGSTGEVSDYKGHWKDRTIEFEPVRRTLEGKPVVDTHSMAFPDPQTMTGRTVIAMADGTKTILEFTAKRLAAPRPPAVAIPEHVACVTDTDCPASMECWPSEHACRPRSHVECGSDRECPDGMECAVIGGMALFGNEHACKAK